MFISSTIVFHLGESFFQYLYKKFDIYILFGTMNKTYIYMIYIQYNEQNNK